MKNDFYKDLFDNSNDLIQSVSPKGEIQYVNKTWLKTLGYKRSEIKDLNIFNIIHPDSLEHCKKSICSNDVRGILGIPHDLDIYKTESIGMRVVLEMASQLNTRIAVTRTGGATYELTFCDINGNQL